ncbi:hypothetical protein A1O1_06038 [Capronia coronata CBS 617.96]|uniref:J domain-containing protein n=1 Tax=Capronia coronata CBS 617.96 TaxID=1182541 RepID=W9XYN8_9EURO|nr:uncharacterized protein A1O1_06038 [Capronia coronata CBS 617.96]EXJ85672.1 hypothetical protein A1O1_06038 [Capronia coronata CBS 617.96]
MLSVVEPEPEPENETLDDYYATLRVSINDSTETITNSFLYLQSEFEPSRCLNWPESTAVLENLVEAHNTLSDPRLRREYDAKWMRRRHRYRTPQTWMAPVHATYSQKRPLTAKQLAIKAARKERLEALATQINRNDQQIVHGRIKLEEIMAGAKILQAQFDKIHDNLHSVPVPKARWRRIFKPSPTPKSNEELQEQKLANKQELMQIYGDLSNMKAEMDMTRTMLDSVGRRAKTVIEDYTTVLQEEMKERMDDGSDPTHRPEMFSLAVWLDNLGSAQKARIKAQQVSETIGAYGDRL